MLDFRAVLEDVLQRPGTVARDPERCVALPAVVADSHVTPCRLRPGEASNETLDGRVGVLRNRDCRVPSAPPRNAVGSEPDDLGIATAHRLEVVENSVLRRARVTE